MLQMMYSTQIRSDCAGYELELKKRRNASAQKLAAAQKAMKEAALDKFEEQNKYDLGQCIVEMEKCITTTGGCGSDYSKCTYYNTGQGLGSDNKKETPVYVKGGFHKETSTVIVGKGTVDAINKARPVCEAGVVKFCVAVKDQVWPMFLERIAPSLKSAELIAENNQRQDTLKDISECFQKACKENMDPKDPDGSYDACLGQPQIMASNCKVVLDRAGVKLFNAQGAFDTAAADKNQIWGFVKAKLGAMRVDACTVQVKKCLQDENRCGKDYAECVGLDKKDILDMCPKEVLTACYENGQNKSAAQLEDMIFGLLLNVDNAQQKVCEAEIEKKMLEVCKDTTNCLEADAFRNESFGALDFCPMTTINGQTINQDYYSNYSASSSSSAGSSGKIGGWWLLGTGASWSASSGSSSSNSSRHSDSQDSTSMTLRTFKVDPDKNPDAQYCSMIRITNTKAASSTANASSSSSYSSVSAGARIFFFGGGGGSSGSSSSTSSSAGNSSSDAQYEAALSFAYTPDYTNIDAVTEIEVDSTEDDPASTTVPKAKKKIKKPELPFATFKPVTTTTTSETNEVVTSTSKTLAKGAYWWATPTTQTDTQTKTTTRVTVDTAQEVLEQRVVRTINDVIASIASSPKISGCLTGRDMSQIRSGTTTGTGRNAVTTPAGTNTARFPRMLDSYAKTIIRDGKVQAIKNFEKSVKKSKDDLKNQAVTNAENALNQSDYSKEEKENLIKMIKSSVSAL
jgi:hypothetical protein